MLAKTVSIAYPSISLTSNHIVDDLEMKMKKKKTQVIMASNVSGDVLSFINESYSYVVVLKPQQASNDQGQRRDEDFAIRFKLLDCILTV